MSKIERDHEIKTNFSRKESPRHRLTAAPVGFLARYCDLDVKIAEKAVCRSAPRKRKEFETMFLRNVNTFDKV